MSLKMLKRGLREINEKFKNDYVERHRAIDGLILTYIGDRQVTQLFFVDMVGYE